MSYYLPLADTIEETPLDQWSINLDEQPLYRPNNSFIGTTQHIWDSVSINLLKECPRKYYFKMIEGWDWQVKPATLQFGIYFHTCMETWHRLIAYGIDKETSLLRVLRLAALLGERLISNRTERTKETLMRSVVWYLDQFTDDQAKTMIMPDGSPAVELSFMLPIFHIKLTPTNDLPPLSLADVVENLPELNDLPNTISGGRKIFGELICDCDLPSHISFEELKESFYTIPVYLAGHIDRVVEFMGESYIADYKTAKRQLDTQFPNNFKPSTQFSVYLSAAHILSSQPNSVFFQPPSGVMIDGIQLGVNFNRYQRFFYRSTQSELNQFLEDLETTIKIKAVGYANVGRWPAEETSCHNYGGCEFLPVCTRPPAEWARLLKANFVKNTWDPSKAR